MVTAEQTRKTMNRRQTEETFADGATAYRRKYRVHENPYRWDSPMREKWQREYLSEMAKCASSRELETAKSLADDIVANCRTNQQRLCRARIQNNRRNREREAVALGSDLLNLSGRTLQAAKLTLLLARYGRYLTDMEDVGDPENGPLLSGGDWLQAGNCKACIQYEQHPCIYRVLYVEAAPDHGTGFVWNREADLMLVLSELSGKSPRATTEGSLRTPTVSSRRRAKLVSLNYADVEVRVVSSLKV